MTRSIEVAARAARRLREEVDSFTLGDPAPGRSALDALSARPPETPKPFSISAKRGDDRGEAIRAERIIDAKRLRRGSEPMLSGEPKPGHAPQAAPDAPAETATHPTPTPESAPAGP